MVNQEKIIDIQKETSGRTIVAATKYTDAKGIRELYRLGINNFGENRVKAFLDKYEELADLKIVWHFIGHLQSKKVKSMIEKVDYLHSLDRISLAEEIQKHRLMPLNCFLEVNISEEDSKYGLKPTEVVDFYHKIKKYDKINVVGLMGMASFTDDQKLVSNQFKKLADLQMELNQKANAEIQFLSMGMSNDYKIALQFGATHLRLGSILFRKED
jgi:pyridoxal phosphate enzyme (YggS family)